MDTSTDSKSGQAATGQVTAHNYKSYGDFLNTADWDIVRQKAIGRAGSICENTRPDGGRCLRPVTEVHHVHYAEWNSGTEQLCDVIALCDACHTQRHTCMGCGRVGGVKASEVKVGLRVCADCLLQVGKLK